MCRCMMCMWGMLACFMWWRWPRQHFYHHVFVKPNLCWALSTNCDVPPKKWDDCAIWRLRRDIKELRVSIFSIEWGANKLLRLSQPHFGVPSDSFFDLQWLFSHNHQPDLFGAEVHRWWWWCVQYLSLTRAAHGPRTGRMEGKLEQQGSGIKQTESTF